MPYYMDRVKAERQGKIRVRRGVAGTTTRGSPAFPSAAGATRPSGTASTGFASSKMGRRKNEKSCIRHS